MKVGAITILSEYDQENDLLRRKISDNSELESPIKKFRREFSALESQKDDLEKIEEDKEEEKKDIKVPQLFLGNLKRVFE